jgi:uncharacterized membrane protein YbaN (DUF454 family)
MAKKSIRNYALFLVGLTAVGLGFVGIFVPLLPTTPFLLLAAACFVRSSERTYRWLTNHKWFGTYIRNYQEYGAIALRGKIGSLILLWAVIGYAILGEISNWPLRVILGVIAIGVTIHILRLKTFRSEMIAESTRKSMSAKEIPDTMS